MADVAIHLIDVCAVIVLVTSPAWATVLFIKVLDRD